MDTILTNLRKELKAHADEKTRESGKRYFREHIELYGIKTATVSQIGKNYFALIKNRAKEEVFDLCQELWKSGIMEESFIACQWSYAVRKQYDKKDIATFERWVNQYVSNWASCDTLCNHTVGTYIEMFPDQITKLFSWATSDNRWVKRAAAVSLIVPARRGKFLEEIFAIADILLMDKDDMVQKGYGWMLKAASESHQKEVFDYVMKKKNVMPRTALRYAIEKMPKDLKTKAMAK